MASILIRVSLHLFISSAFLCLQPVRGALPIVINTWDYTNANTAAWSALSSGGSSVDAVENGCSECERQQCGGTVGFGGSPDEIGETTLDAMIVDGATQDVGAVGDLRRIKSAISVARAVMHFTDHTLLVGESATRFAVEMGFKEEDLHTNASIAKWNAWKGNSCQPNYRRNVVPDPKASCGPYAPNDGQIQQKHEVDANMNEHNHDTIGMVVIDEHGAIAGGSSTNGKEFKVPGRVGDSSLAGAGIFVDPDIGGAAATGDGDIMMRFLPCMSVVNMMAFGASPELAATQALKDISKYYPQFSGAIIAVNKKGDFGAACRGFSKFLYTVRTPPLNITIVIESNCEQ